MRDTMWQCEKCRREFKNKYQNHFCSEQVNSIDAYIAEQPESIQIRLKQVRESLRSELPYSKPLPLELIMEMAIWCSKMSIDILNKKI